MPDEERATLWLVDETDYDNCSHHAVFATREDAKAYADAIGQGAEELPFYPAGTMPGLVEAWRASAAVRRERAYVYASYGGRSSTTVLDNEPPALSVHRFSELSYIPEWARKPCEVKTCGMNGDVLFIEFHGSDRDAVLAACTARYEAGLDAMGARR